MRASLATPLISVAITGLALGAGITATSTTPPTDGYALAGERSQQLAASFAVDLRATLDMTGRADQLAAHAIDTVEHKFGADGTYVQAYALEWEGDATSSVAVLEIEIDVAVLSSDGSRPFVVGNTAGESQQCWRYRASLVGHRVTRAAMPCPTTSVQSQPSLEVPLGLPPGALGRLRAVFGAAPGPGVVHDLVRAFPEEQVYVGTENRAGVVVVSVGARGSSECLIVVRAVDGTVTAANFDGLRPRPAGTECAPSLYTNPMR